MNNLHIIDLTRIKTLFFVFAFTALSVMMPLGTHFFGGPMAGRIFLPMHFFVLAAGLLLGWRAGLAVGLLAPLISFSVSGMPLAAVLPFIILELAAYGFFAGLLRERASNIYLALIGAMALGRIFLWLGIALLPTKLTATAYVLGALQAGWRGMALQIILVPLVVAFIRKFLRDERI